MAPDGRGRSFTGKPSICATRWEPVILSLIRCHEADAPERSEPHMTMSLTKTHENAPMHMNARHMNA